MNKRLHEILLTWPRPYITGTDLHYLLDKSPDSRYSIIKRAIKQGYLNLIRRDLYLISNHSQMINNFEIAPIVSGPSYVSFESALSYHGWIPEAVRTTTSATVKKSRECDTTIGIFSYEHIPIEIFPFGVGQHRNGDVVLFIATPEKAIADFIYTRKRNWVSVDDLSEDLRIEPEEIKKIDKELLSELITLYPNARVKQVLNCLQKGLTS